MSRLDKAFSEKWVEGDRPLVRGLPSDETLDQLKQLIPTYLRPFQTRVITRDMIVEALRYVTGKGASHLVIKLIHRVLEDELKTEPRIHTGAARRSV